MSKWLTDFSPLPKGAAHKKFGGVGPFRQNGMMKVDGMKMNLINIAAGILLAAASAATAQDSAARLTVVGEGRVAISPDMAVVAIGVEANGDTASEALGGMGGALQAVVEQLRTLGITDEEMQTSVLSLTPQYETSSLSGSVSDAGFVASSVLSVTLVDLNDIGQALDAAVSGGANRIDGIQFDLSNRGPVLDRARQLAVADAMARAEVYATASGTTLGTLISLSETAEHPVGFENMAATSVPIMSGEMAVRASVTLVYQLEP